MIIILIFSSTFFSFQPIVKSTFLRTLTHSPFLSAKSASLKKTCTYSLTSHPRFFRCILHKKVFHHSHIGDHAGLYPKNQPKNSLVRVGGVEGEWVKGALTSLIRPTSHNLWRRTDFQPTPSQLSIISRAENC
jgi:hypothetical protein